MLCILAVPYGLGAGAVDAALNNYVALHYSSRHMSWLHCFWGIGASAGPYIMGLCLRSRLGWQSGYRTIAVAQFILTAALFFSLPLWKKADKSLKSNNGSSGDNGADKPVGFISSVKIRGVPLIMLAFFSYCAFESTAGLWASSYFVSCHGINEETAAMLASLYFAGITAGRFFSGFIADRLGDRRMIRYGLLIIFLGLILMIIPVSWTAVSCAGIVIAGLARLRCIRLLFTRLRLTLVLKILSRLSESKWPAHILELLLCRRCLELYPRTLRLHCIPFILLYWLLLRL